MAIVYNKSIPHKKLEKRVSRMSQIAGIRRAVLEGGPEDGVQIADVYTGSGFKFSVNLSRGMDIYAADYCGRSLCWQSPTGPVAPVFYEPEGDGWLRGFLGGLMVTCGLTYLGIPCIDEGQALGLHGRASYLPAHQVRIYEEWVGEDYEMRVQGEMVEALPVVGEHVRLKRKITAHMGESRFFINDAVENFGYKTVSHMILYHINTGYPLLDEGARALIPSLKVTPATKSAKENVARWPEAFPPADGFVEQDFFHNPGADTEGRVMAAVVNPNLDGGLALYISFLHSQLPKIVHWKMCASGNYVMAIEPANCWTNGRANARAKGDLQFLEPGETRHYELEIGIVAGKEAIAELEKRIEKMR